GSVLTRTLLGAGYRVRVLDSFLYGRNSLRTAGPADRLQIMHGDMRDIHTCVQALDGADAVIVLAAIVGDPACSARPSQTIETNVLAAQVIAAACKHSNIARFVYASTCSVYGTGGTMLGEDAPLNPVSLYARTKIASEQTILDMADGYFCPTVLRMGTLYGYSPRMRFDLVVNTMTMKAFTHKQIQVFGGQQWRPLLHVADAADAYLACLQADLDTVAGQVFNTGSDAQNYQIRDIASIVASSTGDVHVERDASTLDARDYRVSFTKIQAALNFRAQHTVETAAKDIFYRLGQGIISNPESKIYYNHYFDTAEE
ncbi:NAD-dependent epimerase/dehydratase family protein, partial [Catelliglobosispora koreensis]|uniref:NAD-dependent epimerase/dehydratase family protein n=1 Tax=Catelliglobosispora koreensis TaxID=129052 RepID=UPI000378E9DA